MGIGERKKFCFFWKSGPFPQWADSKFKGISKFDDDNVEWEFSNAEQWMMFNKALLFNDKDVAEKIMSTSNPRQIKQLGREVRGFKENEWKKHRETIVYDGNYLKFTQNESLYDSLISTVPKTLVEASPMDKIWGIGLNENDDRAANPAQWKGLNLLGYILTRLRDDLIEKKDNPSNPTTTSKSKNYGEDLIDSDSESE